MDLTIASAAMMPYLDWRVTKNPYGSDGFPLVLSLAKQVECISHTPWWKIVTANWESLQECTLFKRDDVMALFIDAASKSIL